MPRSGSTWAFNVVLKLLQLCDPHGAIYSAYNEHQGPLLSSLDPTWGHIIIKSHILDSTSYVLCRAGAAKFVYTWRHPYDAVASMMRMFGHSFEASMGSIRSSIGLWSFHRASATGIIVAYSSIIENPTDTIKRIASCLGLQARPDQVEHVANETSVEQAKRASQNFEQLAPDRIIRDGCHTYDRETLLHHHHIVDGTCGYGEKTLTSQQLRAIDAMMEESGFWSLLDSIRQLET